mmetsp:Transcript_27905/g.28190  ORF Transcript_27905/g.28190 Transcript_27905/m.28190 type:complete len:163 (+) Transcript_27905:101-589(+)
MKILKAYSICSSISRQIQIRFGSSISVILVDNVPNWGNQGELIQVKRGFARNFLIPRKKAVYATRQNKAKYIAENQGEDERTLSPSVLIPSSIVIKKAASPNGVLYGSVSAADIVEALSQIGISISEDNVRIGSNVIKSIGDYEVTIEGIQQVLTIHVESTS